MQRAGGEFPDAVGILQVVAGGVGVAVDGRRAFGREHRFSVRREGVIHQTEIVRHGGENHLGGLRRGIGVTQYLPLSRRTV